MSHSARVVRVVAVVAVLGLVLVAGGCSSRSATPNIVGAMQRAYSFDTFNELVATAGLTSTLQGPGPFTVLAPTDAAFARLPAGRLDELLRPENHALLRDLVMYHIVARKITRDELQKLTSLTTLSNETIQVRPLGQTVLLNDRVQVFTGDIPAANGLIHALDGVLVPPAK